MQKQTHALDDFGKAHGLVDAWPRRSDLFQERRDAAGVLALPAEKVLGERHGRVDFLFKKPQHVSHAHQEEAVYSLVLTMAKRLSKPLTLVGALVNFWLNASERLCAGSVEMSSTDGRCLAS